MSKRMEKFSPSEEEIEAQLQAEMAEDEADADAEAEAEADADEEVQFEDAAEIEDGDVVEYDLSTDEGIEEFLADLDDEELDELEQYIDEFEKLDARSAGVPLAKGEAMADIWLERGDTELKKAVAALAGTADDELQKAMGAFGSKIAGAYRAARAAGAAAPGQAARRLGATFGFGQGGRAARMGAARSAAGMRAEYGAGPKPGAAARGVLFRQRRNAAMAGLGAAGAVGGGVALLRRRRRSEDMGD